MRVFYCLFPALQFCANYLTLSAGETSYDAFKRKDRGIDYALRLEQPIFDLSAWRAYKRAELDRELQHFELREKAADIRLAVLKSYWHAVLLNERSIVFASIYAPLIKNFLLQGEAAVEKAIRSRSESTQWLMALSQLQISEMESEVKKSRLETQLRAWAARDNITLRSRRSSFKPTREWISLANKIVSAVPLLEKADLQKLAAEADLRSAQALYWPRFHLFSEWRAFKGESREEIDSLDGGATAVAPIASKGSSYGLGMNWTIFSGLGDYHENAAAKVLMRAATMRSGQLERESRHQIEDGKRLLQAILQRFEKSEVLRRQTHDWLLGVLKQQKGGLASFDALLMPIARAHEADNLYYQSLQDFFDQYWDIQRKAGVLDEVVLRNFSEQGLE